MALEIPPPILSFRAGEGDQLVSLPRLIQTRLLIQGSSGSGKSYAVRYLCEHTADQIPQLIIDWEGEFASLKEIHGYVLIGSCDEAIEPDIPLDVRTARSVCRRLMPAGASVIIDLSSLELEQKQEYVGLFLSELMGIRKEGWRRRLVLIDEAQSLCPQGGTAPPSAAPIKRLVSQGRKRGYCVVVVTQRIAELHKAAAEVQCKMFFRTTLDVDLDRVRRDLGFSAAKAREIATLKDGQCFCMGPAFVDMLDVQMLRTGDVKTEHKDGTTTVHALPTPAEIAAALKDLNKAAGDIATDAGRQEMLEEIERLKAQLQAARDGNSSDPADIRRAVDKAEEPLQEQIKALTLQLEMAKHHARAILLDNGEIPPGDASAPPGGSSPGEEPDLSRPLEEIEQGMIDFLRDQKEAVHKYKVAEATGQGKQSSTFRAHIKFLIDKGLIIRPRLGYLQIAPEEAV
jgi:hypothetical protein